MNGDISFSEVHSDYQLWNNELHFYHEELIILQKDLDELIARNTSLQLSDEAFLYQNQFVRMDDHLVILLHNLKSAEASMAILARTETPVDLSTMPVRDHWLLGQKITGFKKDFESLKYKYKMFQLKLY